MKWNQMKSNHNKCTSHGCKGFRKCHIQAPGNHMKPAHLVIFIRRQKEFVYVWNTDFKAISKSTCVHHISTHANIAQNYFHVPIRVFLVSAG